MKNLILLLSCGLSSLSFAGVSILSDLDDTIKMTNAGSVREATYNGIFGRKVFQGMSEFLGEARSYTQSLHVITASPGLIAKSVEKTLKQNDIKFESIFYKNPLKRESTLNYKVRRISDFLDKNPDDIILLGDDVNHDPEVFLKIMENYPQRVVVAYIHIVKGREIPAGVVTYHTAYELAVRENQAGRMGLASVEKVYNSFTIEDEHEFVFPHYSVCPISNDPWKWLSKTFFAESSNRLAESLTNFCKTRTSTSGKLVTE